MSQQIITSSEVERVPVDLPGATLQVLHNEIRGGMTALAHLAPGIIIPEHWHTHADETLYMLSGDLVIAGVAYGPGTFFVVSGLAPSRVGRALPAIRAGQHETL